MSAYLTEVSIPTGGSTTLVLDARNNGTMIVNGSFEIIPENDQVVVERRDDAVPLRPLESAGRKRYNVSAYSTFINQSILITVNFKDAGSNSVIGSTTVILNVHKGE